MMDGLLQARSQLRQLLESVDSILEALEESSIEDVRPRLSELMHRLLEGTRIIVETSEVLQGAVCRDVESAQKVLSERLLEFRRAMGSGSTDTIQGSLRTDLAISAENWIGLAEILIEHIETLREDA
tara:strand:+ start:1137 stop:1517 length:381 start_codon:yes stop_codon:yes gene_type:complete